jgi:TolB-like protein/DNA-binding winged helix-turn-helix (wHTH) protein
MKSSERISLGSTYFHPATRELRDETDAVIPLRAQSSEVLAVLVQHPGEIVEKQFLHDEVWASRVVTDSSLAQCIADIRRALGDSREILQTVPRRGYRLQVAESLNCNEAKTVATVDELPLDASYKQGTANYPNWLPSRGGWILLSLTAIGLATFSFNLFQRDSVEEPVSIAILPFDDLSPGDQQGFLSDAIPEVLTNELSRFAQFAVVARTSSFRYRENRPDVKQISKELGAVYLVTGSQQKYNDELRVTAFLIDGVSGQQIWSETYDRKLEEFFTVQSDIVRNVASNVGNEIVYRSPPDRGLAGLDSLRYYLKGMEELVTGERIPETYMRAADLMGIAITKDPRSAWGHIGMSHIYWVSSLSGWDLYGTGDSLEKGVWHADTALKADPENYMAHWSRGQMHKEAGEQEEAIRRFEAARELNPNSVAVRGMLAAALAYSGRFEEAYKQSDFVLSKSKRRNTSLWSRGMIHYLADECDTGYQWFQKMSRIPLVAGRHYSALLVCVGKVEEARELMARYKAKFPSHTISRELTTEAKKMVTPGHAAKYIEHLRIAGMPEF